MSSETGTYIPNFDSLLEMLDGGYDTFTDNSGNRKKLDEKLTNTLMKQIETEISINEIYQEILFAGSDSFPHLNRNQHIKYTHGFLSRRLPGGFVKLEASKSWICFWLMNSTVILGSKLTKLEIENASSLLFEFYKESGSNGKGFGGGEYQLPHLAASYAAISALLLTEDREIWDRIDKNEIKNWLLEMKCNDGSFMMHKGGESDTRAVYCALCIALLFNILDEELTCGVKEWLISCQTYEGGFGGLPGDEAHGGYTYCALAALFILLNPDEIINSELDINTLIKWTADRQFSLEGGFSGRTNKLVDGCYSHWVGGTGALLECLINYANNDHDFIPIIDRQKLQNYILCCCQDKFGLRDKPGCMSDFYHTNYVLCGLSMCQYFQKYNIKQDGLTHHAFSYVPERIESSNIIDNLEINEIAPLDVIFGLPYGYALRMHEFYKTKDIS